MKFETEELLREAVGDDQVRSRRALISKNATTGHGSKGTPSTCAGRGVSDWVTLLERATLPRTADAVDDAKAVVKVAGPAGHPLTVADFGEAFHQSPSEPQSGDSR